MKIHSKTPKALRLNFLSATMLGSKIYSAFFLIFLLACNCFCQTTLINNIPPSPEASQLIMDNLDAAKEYTGSISKSIALHNIKSKNLKDVITLNYNSSGFKVSEDASQVGLGWSLNMGGVITRIVKGLPDDSQNGYYNTMENLSNLNYDDDEQFTPTVSLCDAHKITQQIIDSYPDEYLVDLGHDFAKLVFDQNQNPHFSPAKPWKITGNLSNGFTLLDEYGTKYIFDKIAEYECISKSKPITSSNWELIGSEIYNGAFYLTSKSSADGSVINYNYDSYNYSVFPYLFSEVDYIQLQQDNYESSYDCIVDAFEVINTPWSCHDVLPSLTYFESKYYYNSWKLTSIVGEFEKAVIKYDSRSDVLSQLRMTGVEIWNTEQNTKIKTFDFIQTYFSGPRLRLDELIIKTIPASQQLDYKFSYYETGNNQLPSKASYACDYWGYYNGANGNTGYVPEIVNEPLTTFVNYLGANRKPSPNHASAFMLKRIEFPSGGFQEYTYEPHGYSYFNDEIDPGAYVYISENDYVEAISPGINGNSNYETQTSTFNLEFDQRVSIFITGYYDVNNYHNAPYTIVLTGPNNFYESFSYTQPPGTYYRLLESGSYTMTISVFNFQANPVEWASANVTFLKYDLDENDNPIMSNEGSIVGGSRLASVETSDGNGSSQKFIYKYQFDTEASSGVITQKPIFIAKTYVPIRVSQVCSNYLPTKIYDCAFISRTGNSMSELGSSKGAVVGYARVEKWYGEGAENGKEVFHYSSGIEHPDEDNITPFFEYGGTLPPLTSYEDLRGLLLKHEKFNAQNEPIESTVNNYNLDNSIDATTGYVSGVYSSIITTGTFYENGCADWNDAGWEINFEKFQFLSLWPRILSSESKTYSSPNNYISTVTEYEYENDFHKQITSQKSTNSNGDQHIAKKVYPLDLVDPTSSAYVPPGGNHSEYDAIARMIEENVLALPIENRNYVVKNNSSTPLLTGGSITVYDEFNNNLFRPTRFFSCDISIPEGNISSLTVTPSGGLQAPNQFVECLSITSQNPNNGNILEQKLTNGEPECYEWGYEDIFPILKANNAHQSDIAIANMETGMNNWTLNSANSYSTDPFTGENSRQINADEEDLEFILDDISQDRKFKFSAWVKTSSSFGSNAGIIKFHTIQAGGSTSVFPSTCSCAVIVNRYISGTNNEWTLFEGEIDIPDIYANYSFGSGVSLALRFYVENNDSSEPLFIDDIRIHPVDALVDSYTFNPQKGITSKLDARNQRTTYEYDDFGRLKMTRDHDLNILSKTEYNYQQ